MANNPSQANKYAHKKSINENRFHSIVYDIYTYFTTHRMYIDSNVSTPAPATATGRPSATGV